MLDRDLFGHIANDNEPAKYPDSPGFKGAAETGREAAEAIAPKLGRLQRMVREAVAARGSQGITPEEACDVLAVDRVSLQPRFSELRAKGQIADSGERRRNPSSGKSAVVWVLPEYAAQRDAQSLGRG